MPEFTAAMIGHGMVAATHLRALHDLRDRVRLKGVLGRDPERAAAFLDAAEVGDPRPQVYRDLAAVADDPQVDFVLLLTPPNARAEPVAALAGAGKAILMEKPVERTTDAARALVETCEAAGVPLGLCFQHRFREVSQILHRRLAELGPLRAVEAHVPWWRPQSYYDPPGRGTYARDGGGVLINQAVHTLDLMLWLAGPVTRVQAMATTTGFHTMEAEDFVSAGLRFANGAVGALTASTASFPGSSESLTLHGVHGSAQLRAGVLRLDWQDGRAETLGAVGGTGGGADPMAFTHAWHRDLIADFLEALRTGRPPAIPGRAALATHAVIDALTASARAGRAVEVAS
ncbi:MAG: Gfo/Idh/MocA family oxidoreductase [Pseudomonadota bacterium]